MRRIRINGLVAMANALRSELASGVTAERREELRRRIAGELANVQEILREAGMPESALPAPSRRALQFVRNVDWNAPPTGNGEVPQGRITFPGLTGFVERAVHRLADGRTEQELDAIHQSIALTSRRIEGLIERERIEPQRLGRSMREARGWVGFFAERGNVAVYAQAVERARAPMQRAAAALRYPGAVQIQFRPVHVIYRMRPGRGRVVVMLPTPMITFEAAGFELLEQLASTRLGETKRQVTALMSADAYQLVRAELEALGGVVEVTRGAHHDLAVSFERVNQRYFSGQLSRPHLTWSRVFTGRKFGHYDSIKDTVLVSSTLDRGEVPAFVVDFLMYHELLHKKLGSRWVNGRRYSHTTEFLEMERRFQRFGEAEAWLQKLART